MRKICLTCSSASGCFDISAEQAKMNRAGSQNFTLEQHLDAVEDFLWHIWQGTAPKSVQLCLSSPLTRWCSDGLFLRHRPSCKHKTSVVHRSALCRTLEVILIQVYFFLPFPVKPIIWLCEQSISWCLFFLFVYLTITILKAHNGKRPMMTL